MGARVSVELAFCRNLAFLQTLPGFKGHTVFQTTSGPTTFDIVTIAVWENAEAIANAGEKVRVYYESIGLDIQEPLSRTGIIASLGYYNAPVQQ